MPVYEYECASCGQSFEKLQSVSGRAPRTCPYCQKAGTVRRLVSAPAFQFKGTGWYVTDYAGKGKGEGKGDDKGEAKKDGAESASDDKTAKADDKADGKSDKKDTKKPESKPSKTASEGD
ncbi:MAG TPA: zinc ribbon domain-containing protein [Thermoanaerobaculia bacterium]|nr:zinc ribbon domain-containing protein [Thermoanaerobaculia bacterium]